MIVKQYGFIGTKVNLGGEKKTLHELKHGSQS